MKTYIGDWFGIFVGILGMGVAVLFMVYILINLYSETKYYDPLYFEKKQLKHIDECHKLGGKVVYNDMNIFDGCLEK